MANSSTSEELQKRRPRARVFKAFSTLSAGPLAVDEWASTATKPSIFLAGDDLRAKEIVRGLARDAGFEALDAGPPALLGRLSSWEFSSTTSGLISSKGTTRAGRLLWLGRLNEED